MTSYSDSITDGVGTHDAQVIGYPVALSDSFRVPGVLAVVRARAASIADTIGLQDAAISALGVLVAESLKFRDSQIPNHHAQLAIVERIITSELIARGLPLSIVDGLGIELVQAAAQLVAIVEKLGLKPLLVPAFAYHLSVNERITYADILARFIGASIAESMQLVDLMVGSALKPGAVTEAVGISPELGARMVLRVDADEDLEITDAELIKMIFDGAIVEGLEIAAAYLGPSGSITTWVMNTRTAAVTEYTNYTFNSFARMGNKYLGATKDGLYELTGDDDAGSSIIADLKSGLAQFAGVRLASFKAAYIAARGGGSYVLRIFTGDGDRYDYAVTADNMKTARIDMGKGIRARYFAFELVSVGQDFDLESLEFVPLVAKRRV